MFISEKFLEVAAESWPERDLNPRPLVPLRRSNRLSYKAMSSTCSYN